MQLEKLNTAEIVWSKEGYPSSGNYQDKYFSRDGIKESQYVFLDGNQLNIRWQQSSFDEFNILETGFGCGLNFMVTFELWKQHIDRGNLCNTQVNYFSIENSPLSLSDFKKVIKLWPSLTDTASLLISKLPQPVPGRHLIHFHYKQQYLSLYLLFTDVEVALNDLISENTTQFNAYYMDGFSPAKNNMMWSNSVFSKISILAKEKSTLATYSASSEVTRNLENNNFSVKKIKGFGSKREMIQAESNNESSIKSKSTVKLIGKHYAVIGAGLSGCITASKLAKLGAKVSLIESSNDICQGASGNDYGLAYPRLANGYDSNCLLHLSGICYLQQQLKDLKNVRSDFSGLKILIGNQNPNSRINQHTLSKIGLNSDFAEYHLNNDSHFINFKTCGSIFPRSLAQAYLHNETLNGNIKIYLNSTVMGVTNQNKKWTIQGQGKISEKHYEKHYDGIIFCTGFESIQPILQYQKYCRPVAGQIDQFKVSKNFKKLTKPVCGRNYIIPNYSSNSITYWVGASYQVDSIDKTIKQHDIDKHRKFLAEQLNIDSSAIEYLCSRTAVRQSSNDRLPLVGKVADIDAYESWFNQKLTNRKNHLEEPFIEGLFVNIAHGSHGLTTIPIVSEHLVNLISGSASALPNFLREAIQPQRFQQRQIKKKN